MVYLHKQFQYHIRDMYVPNNLWEGQFLDITGKNLQRKVTLCNVYRPPRDRNEDIERFLTDLSPCISTLSDEPSDKLIMGDFNIDVLKTNIREKYADFLDLMLNNDFLPKITLPTRFSEKSASLIDNIFCNFSHSTKSCRSGIIFTDLSDHFPYFTCLNQKINLNGPPKLIKVQTKNCARIPECHSPDS